MRNIYLFGLFCLILLFGSYKSRGQSIQNADVMNMNDIIEAKEASNDNLIEVDYSNHKDILNILTILSANSMGTWEWSERERKEFVDYIEKKNAAKSKIIENDLEGTFTIREIKANTIGIQIIDGYWTLSIYKIKTENYIVITNDMVGDGNDINAYEYIDGTLNGIKLEDLFGDYFLELLIDVERMECVTLLEDYKIVCLYNFSDTEKVVISCAYYLSEEDSEGCFKGNTLFYKFDSEKKKFILEKIEWMVSD